MNEYITVPVPLPTGLPSQDRSFTVMAKQFFVERVFPIWIQPPQVVGAVLSMQVPVRFKSYIIN